MTEAPEYLTAREVAERLRVSVMTVHRLVERGDLRAIRVGNQLRIPRDSYEAYTAQ